MRAQHCVISDLTLQLIEGDLFTFAFYFLLGFKEFLFEEFMNSQTYIMEFLNPQLYLNIHKFQQKKRT